MSVVRPENVRIRKPSGQVIPCEPVFKGYDNEIAVWELDTVLNLGEGDRLLVGMMPARTSLVMPSGDDESVRPVVRVGSRWRETISPLLWLIVFSVIFGACLGVLL